MKLSPMRWLAIAALLLGVASGGYYIGMGVHHLFSKPSSERCFVATIAVNLQGDTPWIAEAKIGEQVICAREFKWTPIYGPDLESYFQRGAEFEDGP